jgi:hypothetical protein
MYNTKKTMTVHLLQTNYLTINSIGKDYIHTEAIRVKYGSRYLVRKHATRVTYDSSEYTRVRAAEVLLLRNKDAKIALTKIKILCFCYKYTL